MTEYCPRERCAWTNSIYSKCTWPGGQCPYQHERDKAAAAEDAKKEAVEASRKARKHQQRLAMEAYKSGRATGVYPKNGKWTANIYVGGKTVYLGIYQTEAEAIAARELAQTHRDDVDFLAWLERWCGEAVKRRGSRDKG